MNVVQVKVSSVVSQTDINCLSHFYCRGGISFIDTFYLLCPCDLNSYIYAKINMVRIWRDYFFSKKTEVAEFQSSLVIHASERQYLE